MSLVNAKSARICVRMTSDAKAILQRAANATHKNITDFLLDAGVRAAEEALANRRLFVLDDTQWDAFQAILGRPLASKPKLARLLLDKDILE